MELEKVAEVYEQLGLILSCPDCKEDLYDNQFDHECPKCKVQPINRRIRTEQEWIQLAAKLASELIALGVVRPKVDWHNKLNQIQLARDKPLTSEEIFRLKISSENQSYQFWRPGFVLLGWNGKDIHLVSMEDSGLDAMARASWLKLAMNTHKLFFCLFQLPLSKTSATNSNLNFVNPFKDKGWFNLKRLGRAMIFTLSLGGAFSLNVGENFFFYSVLRTGGEDGSLIGRVLFGLTLIFNILAPAVIGFTGMSSSPKKYSWLARFTMFFALVALNQIVIRQSALTHLQHFNLERNYLFVFGITVLILVSFFYGWIARISNRKQTSDNQG